MSRKPGNREPASEENKQFDPGGTEGSHRFEKRMYCYYFLFVKELSAWTPGLFLLSLPICLLCIVLIR